MRYLTLFAFIFFLFLPLQNAQSETSQLPGVIDTRYVWQSTTINVCWHPSARSYPRLRAHVKNLIVTQYNNRTNVKLVGWGECSNDVPRHDPIWGTTANIFLRACI